MKSHNLLIIASLLVFSLVGCQTTGDTRTGDDSKKVSITQTEQYGDLSGNWKSIVDSRWGGGLNVYIDQNEGSSNFKGKLAFWHSGCPWKTPFNGTISETGEVELKANPGGQCGKVIIKGTFKDGIFLGTYDAEYPDNGNVRIK